MAIDFAKAKADIKEIVEIVKTIPEPLQQRCFELLFEAAFTDKSAAARAKKEEAAAGDEDTRAKTPPPAEKKLPPNVMAFMRRHSISQEELGKLFMVDHDPLLPVYTIPQGKMAKSQLTKVMMILLENALLNNTFTANYSELRDTVKEDGLYDGNFSAMLRSNSKLFKGAVTASKTDETGIVELSGEGMGRLAEVVKELGQ